MSNENLLDYIDAEKARLIRKHHEQVLCPRCHEWTTYGESCCSVTICADECPVCSGEVA
jgi:hypothetical protein